MSQSKHFITIGCGVIGLQTSLTLLEAGHRVTIIAKHIPGDLSIEYCSPWAGAQWRSHAAPDDARQQAWDLATYDYWMDLAAKEAAEGGADKSPGRSGVTIRKNFLVYDKWGHADIQGSEGAADVQSGRGFWFKDHVKGFHVVAEGALPGLHLTPTQGSGEDGTDKDVVAAVAYDTPFVDVPRYLAYLKARILEFDGRGRVVKIEDGLPSTGGLAKLVSSTLQIMEMSGLVESASEVAAIINATGMGAREIIGGEEINKMYPSRGQVLIVNGVAKSGCTRQGENYIAYVIPRPGSGTTVIGGCKEAGNWNADADVETSKKIMARCKLLCPELLTKEGDFEVIGTQVGLRPSRRGGARVEKELVKLPGAEDVTVIHAYGMAGAGLQNSIGVAHDVLSLLQG